MVLIDPVFESIPAVGSQVPVFEVWRVEKLKLVPVPRTEHGQFFSGDSYLLYWDREGRQDIFFWLGCETSQDEQGVAAIKAVELDELLGGSPVQHREVQGHESQDFLSAFPSGLIIRSGGVESGMRKVNHEHQTKLYRIAGGKYPMVIQVPLGWGQMNCGDVFILDAGPTIFVWRGSKSSLAEKREAARLADVLKDKPGEKIVLVDDGAESELEKDEQELFCKFLPLDERDQLGEKVDGGDEKIRASKDMIDLYQCTDKEGEMKISHVKCGNLCKTDLAGDDSFIIDGHGTLGIWVWIGKGATQAERREGMNSATKFIQEKCYPPETRITRVVQGGENQEFISLFQSWK